ncbi:MAG TPA: VCBS repeat-containing protein [Opitutaceae bacterium]|nr:VCBS repeat-containing protein [Opitutaceae bacterium]
MRTRASNILPLCLSLAVGAPGLPAAGDVDHGSIVESALAPRSAPRGATLFTVLDAATIGIVAENKFADPEMWGERYHEFTLGLVGTGIAIGDYDGDGRPDVFVVSKTEQSRLFRNLGGWKFEDVTERAGLATTQKSWFESAKSWAGLGGAVVDSPEWWKQGATFADVNNNGLLDIYVCRFKAANLLYINQGDGTFKEEAAARGLAVVDASGVGAFCDFDRDGWLDVFVATNLLDAALHPQGQRGYLFRNKGDGTFEDVTDRAGIRGELQAHAATWWDFDNDGWPDLHIANDFAGPDYLYRNNRDGTFTDVIHEVVPQMPYSSMGADLGDVDNDGRIDLFVADMAATTHEKDHRGMAYSRGSGNTAARDPSQRPQSSRNMLYLNTGTGRVQEAAFLAGLARTDWTWSTRFEDLDNDGRLDLFVTNGMVREFQNADLLERLMGAGTPGERTATMRASPKLTETTLAFRNMGDLRFDEVGAGWGLSRRGVSLGAAFGDLDGDGDMDLIYSNYEGGVTVLRNDSDTGHRAIFELRGRRSNRWGVGATVRIETQSGKQVRTLVLARGYLSSSEPMLHFGLGDDTMMDRVEVEWPSGVKQVFTDLPVDRRFTVTESASATERVNAELQTPTQAAHGWAASEVQSRPMFSPTNPPQSLLAVDPTRAVADFDRDGRLDEFIGGGPLPGGYPASGRSVLLRDRDGARSDVTDTIAPGLRDVGLVTAAIWCDVDADGWPDLLVALDWGEVKYFRNDRGVRLEDWTDRAGFASGGTGWWSALAAGDLNGDGRPDVVAGNTGLNTQYRASPTHPALLFLGDFAGRGVPAIVEAYFEGDSLFPWRTRKDIGKLAPDVLKRFPRNNAFARATLPEILGEARLSAARRFAATELRSGVFLSQTDGTHRFVPFPRIAQIAPVQGIAIADFDGDGLADVYLVQNRRATPPSFGDFDGGLSQLLLGDGEGNFSPVPPADSGLVVAEETTAVAVHDLDNDGWPDLVVTRGDGSRVAFRNNGVPGRRPPGVSGKGSTLP